MEGGEGQQGDLRDPLRWGIQRVLDHSSCLTRGDLGLGHQISYLRRGVITAPAYSC